MIWLLTASVMTLAVLSLGDRAFAEQTGGNGGNSYQGNGGGAGGETDAVTGAATDGGSAPNVGEGAGGGGGGAGIIGGAGGSGDGGDPAYATQGGAGGSAAINGVGGNGGNGGEHSSLSIGGGGGGGGAHGAVAATFPSSGPLIGGAGGNGGNGAVGASGGGGGAGGYGAFITGVGGTNLDAITGGNGGAGGYGQQSGDGGVGGVGVFFAASGGVLINQGAILGGNGGGSSATAGAGGAGVVGAGLTIDNTAGTISGGIWGDGRQAADAITFTGGANTLTLAGTGGLGGNIGITAAGSTVTFNQSAAATLNNIITGAGGIVQNGAGTLTLGGANTYAGATSVTAGMLSISNGAALGGTTQGTSVSSGATLALSGDIAVGAEALTIAGLGASGASGALVNLSGTNSFAGPITQSAASTIASDAGRLTLSGSIAGNFGLTLTGAGSGTISGAIATGNGALTKTGSGTWTLSGANTYAGNTAINAGVLQISNGNALGAVTSLATVASGATLQIAGDITVQKGLRLSGAGAAGTTGALVNVSGTNTLSGNVDLLANSTIAVDAGTLTLSGVVWASGYTLDVTGPGTLVLSGSGSVTQTNIASGATLQIGAGGLTGLLAGDIVNDGELAFNRSNSHTYGRGISGSGSLTKLGAGALYLSGDNTYSGTTTISAGTLYIGDGGTTGSIVGDVVNNSALAFYRSNALTYGGVISGTGQVGVGGGGTVTLTGANTHTGGTWISGSTLQIGAGGTTGSLSGNVATEYSGVAGALAFNRSNDLTYAGVISGIGTLTKQGAGVLTLTGANTVSGGTTISAGTLQIGNGGTTGSLAGAIANDGALIFNRTGAVVAGSITGTGTLTQRGAGTVTLSGINSAGGTTVEAGTLALQTASVLTSDVQVASGATLARASGGAVTAAINGVVTVANGGHISVAPVGGGNYGLSVTDLVLNSTSNVDVALGANLGAAAIYAQTLTLDGVLNVTNTGGMTFGTYRIIDYGTLAADNGLTLGSMPFGFEGVLQTSVANQVNLVLGSNALFWNGSTTTADGTIHGGNGTWSAVAQTNWTDAAGTLAGAWQGGTAIFQGAPGAVTVNTSGGAVNVAGMQFAVDGYQVSGGTLTLANTGGQTGIRVGDGTAAGATYVATISSVLAGTSGLDKQDLGTLVLTGANTYTGGTTVSAGTLQIGDGVTNGSIVGDVVNNSNLVFNPAAAQTYAGAISGTGSLFKQGSGTLTLTGANTYTGGTSITGGRLIVSGGRSLSDHDGLIIGSAGTLELLDADETVGWLSGAGAVHLNGNGLTVASGGTTFSGSISGSGSLTKTGTGTLTLSGNNTYSGETTVAAGVLRIENVNFLSSTTGEVTVLSGAALHLAAGNSQSSRGALTLNGMGVASDGALRAVSGDSYFGTVTLGSATKIQVDAAGYLGLDRITGNNTDLTVDGAGNMTVEGSLSIGTGGLVKNGAGDLLLMGANVFTGTTTVNDGTLTLQNGHAIRDTSAVVINTAGALYVVHSEAIGSLAGAGNVHVWSDQTLTIGDDNTSTTFSGVLADYFMATYIEGGGLRKTGSGTLSLTGTNTYTGATTVDGGTLSVNGSIASSSLTVNAGGTLGGNGIVGNTTINGGTLAPGNSIDTLTVQGNLSFTAASRYMVEVSPSNADRVNVTGTATLGGATVNAHFAAGSYVEKQYTIVNATGGVIGKFGAQVNTDLPSSFKSSLSYDANNAYLDLKLDFTPVPPTPGPTPPVYVALNGNQAAVGNALVSYFNHTGGIPLVFGALDAKGLTQASGELGTGSQQTTFDAMNMFMGVMTDPFAAGRSDGAGAVSAFTDEAMAHAGRRDTSDAFAAMQRKAPPLMPAFHERWNVWAAGFGGSQRTDGNAIAGSNNTTSSIYGTAVGADYWFSPDTIAGFSLAGGGTNFSVNGGGSGRSDLFQAGGFVRHMMGSTYVTAAAAYGWQDITMDRFVTMAGVDHLRANFNANTYSGRLEVGNRFVTPWVGGLGLTPYGAVQVTAFDLPSYAESTVSGATTFALAYAGKTITATRTELGLRSDKSFALDHAILTLRGRAAWAHDFNTDRSASATFQTLPGAGFVVNGAALASNAALTTASAEMKWLNGWSVAATFEGEFSDVTRSYSGKGLVRYAW